MSDQQWHVFYRTIGMQETKARGFLRADFMAESAEMAIEMLIDTKRNVFQARAYPGAAAFTVRVDYEPIVRVRHQPHEGADE